MINFKFEPTFSASVFAFATALLICPFAGPRYTVGFINLVGEGDWRTVLEIICLVTLLAVVYRRILARADLR